MPSRWNLAKNRSVVKKNKNKITATTDISEAFLKERTRRIAKGITKTVLEKCSKKQEALAEQLTAEGVGFLL